LDIRKIDRRLITILLIVLVQMLGAAMILPILPLYAQREFALSPTHIALLSTSFFAAQFIAGPYLGRFSDKYGRVPVLIVSQVGTVISFLLLAVAPNATFLFMARILDGITGGNIIVAQAYITDITPRERRTEALGYIFAVFGLGFVVGPAIGGLLSAGLGARTPYLIAAAAAFVVVLLTWFTLEESITPEKRQASREASGNSISPRMVIRNKPLIYVLMIAFFGQAGMGLLRSTFALYAEAVLLKGYEEELTTLGVGLLYATIGLSQLTTQVFLIKRLLSKFGEYYLIIIGNTSRLFASFVYAVITSPILGGVNSFFFAFGVGVMMPSLQSLATDTVEDEYRGGVLGLYQSTLSLSVIVGSVAGGLLYEISVTMPYWVGGLMALIAFIPAFLLMAQFGRQNKVGEQLPGKSSLTPPS
jgi:DHA1 family tetracycline resistance protein-like MFS transporter